MGDGESLRGNTAKYRIEVLATAGSGVDDFAASIYDDHVRCGGGLVCSRADALFVIEGVERRLVLLDIPPYPLAGLVHRDIDTQELDLRAVRCACRSNLRKQLLAQLTPGGPEFEKEWLASNIPSEIDGVAIQIG